MDEPDGDGGTWYPMSSGTVEEVEGEGLLLVLLLGPWRAVVSALMLPVLLAATEALDIAEG